MSGTSRGLLLTVILTVLAAIDGTWIGARFIYEQRHQPSLHESTRSCGSRRSRSSGLRLSSKTLRCAAARERRSFAPPTPNWPRHPGST